MIAGSLGMLASASLGKPKGDGLYFGLFEPSGGTAPDIAGKGIANPIAQILSAALMLRFSLGLEKEAAAIENAVRKVIDDGLRTGDIFSGAEGTRKVGTKEIGDAIVAALCQVFPCRAAACSRASARSTCGGARSSLRLQSETVVRSPTEVADYSA